MITRFIHGTPAMVAGLRPTLRIPILSSARHPLRPRTTNPCLTPAAAPAFSNPRPPLPPFCNQSAVVVDYTKISTISRHDIENHLHFLGLIDLHAGVDVGIILTSALTDKRRRSGLDGFTGTFSGALGRITGGNSLVNNKDKGNGHAGNGNVHGNGNSTSDGKATNEQASDPLLPPGIDPEAIRRVLIHQYTVQCGFSYRTHRGVRTTTAASYTECLHTCATHAFFSATGAGANACLGGSFERRAGSGRCWYIVGAVSTTLDSRRKVADENCDSFSL
ncbi:hypothetical protein PG993_010230 [Apiospora rasikravindrae]|uniref:Uncharacterized protein n=1 Tax=Apiospora rasikravindrae TaxID=990691 RepID=A0ABR1SLM7_9PEZI